MKNKEKNEKSHFSFLRFLQNIKFLIEMEDKNTKQRVFQVLEDNVSGSRFTDLK